MKKKDTYTIVWDDHLDASYIHRVQAYDQKHALHQWGIKFSKETIGYNLTEEECQALVEAYDFFEDFINDRPEILEIVYNSSKKQIFKNVWYSFMHYDLQGIEDPSLNVYVIKNRTKGRNRTFTFYIKFFLGSQLIQNEAPSVQVAFSKWKEEILTKGSSNAISPYNLQRFQRALKKQKNVHLSPVARHPGVWRWRLLVGRVPCTLYIVATDNHIQEDMMHLYEDKKTTYETK